MIAAFRFLFSTFFAALAASVAVQGQSPEFETDIRPIFQKHCFKCHAGENLEGNLDLSSLAGIRNGGHSGSPLLASTLEHSELYLRIVSTADGYRMPKTGPPLSESEVSVLEQWIPLAAAKLEFAPADVAAFRYDAVRPGNESTGTPATDRQFNKPMGYIVICGLGLLALSIWLVFRIRQTIVQRRGDTQVNHARARSNGLRWILGISTVIVLALLSAWSLYSYGAIQQLEQAKAELQLKLESERRPDGNKLILIDNDHLPLPVHPMHPRRLGGQYYRGNDERSEQLFNGGFYRTATIDLHLIDQAGQRLQWSDEIDGEAFIELSIRRSPATTKELFSARTRNLATIEHYCPTNPDTNLKTKFESVEEFEHWRAIIPLPPKSRWTNRQVEGMVYIMYGRQVGGPNPRPHFGARYNLILEGNRISNDSDLWLGNMFTLGGRVLVPQPGEVLLDRWFDWRPIPEIKGRGSTDPELLGIPEHQK